MRAEDEDLSWLRAGGMRADGGHQFIENAPGQDLTGAMLPQELVKLVLAKVVVGELEKGLAHRQTQPDQRASDKRRGPVHRSGDPGPTLGRQVARRRFIDDEGRVGM